MKTFACPRCRTTSPLHRFDFGTKANAVTLEEEATLTCPICGAVFELTAQLKKPVEPGPPTAPPTPETPPSPGEAPPTTPPAEGEAPETGTPAELTPAGESRSASRATQARVLQCNKCSFEWIGVRPVCSGCGSRDVKVSKKSTKGRVEETFRQVEAGGDIKKALSILFGEVQRPTERSIKEQDQRDKNYTWTGSLGEFNTKLQALAEDLGVVGDLGDLVVHLQGADILDMRDEVIEFRAGKARQPLVSYLEDNIASPALQAVGVGTGEEGQGVGPLPPQKNWEELVDKVLVKYF